MKDFATVLERSNELISSADQTDRRRIRDVMNGGAKGLQAVLNNYDGNDLGVDLPTANVMYSGMERMAQRSGRIPTLKTSTVPVKDTDLARRKNDKRARIVQGWDDMQRYELHFPQIGRWVPGYGFAIEIIKGRTFGDTTYPVAELRDPYDVYPGMWGVDQQPADVAIVRHISRREISKVYPHIGGLLDLKAQNGYKRASSGGVILNSGRASGWEGNPAHPVQLIEYMCDEGTYIICPEAEAIAGFIPNILESGPNFVIGKRFSFDALQGHFHHVFGLMAMMAKLNMLSLIAAEDSVFRETNIIGEMKGRTYKRGRFAVNLFEPGARVEKPTQEQINQAIQTINVLERQFRTVSGYDVAQDGQSPNSFATGQGIRELGQSANDNIREYQLAFRHMAEVVDRKRLEWEEAMHRSAKRQVYWYEGSKTNEETYVPSKDIAGDYRTKRVYGAMATFDENSKIISGLQLLQAGVLDRRTLRENLDGVDEPALIQERIDQDMAKEMLIQGLGQRFGQMDPAAGLALVEIFDSPDTTADTLKKLFTPEQPEMSPEEEAMVGGLPGAPPGGPEMAGGPPPPVQTILAQMEAEGGGAMTVGQMQ